MGKRASVVAGVGLLLGALTCVGPASAQTKKLGLFGGWAVSEVFDKGKFVRCVADTTGGSENEGFRMSFMADGKRLISLPGGGTPNGTKEQVTLVLQPSGKRFTFTMVQGNPNRLWSSDLQNSFTDVFFASKRMEMIVPERNLKRVFGLGDPDTMSARIDGCVTSNQDQSALAPPPKPSASAPAARPAQAAPSENAVFCQQYADAASTAAKDAIAINPSCQDASKGVHPIAKAHLDWCLRTDREKVEGASTHIRRLASQCTQGALAAPADYGGYSIVGNEKFERPYGQAGTWQVRAALSGHTFMYCVAVSTADPRRIRLGADLVQPGASLQWQLAVPMRGPKEWEGSFQIDGKGFGSGGGKQMSGVGAGGWSIAWLGAPEVDALRKGGREGVVGIGTQDYDFSLDGVPAAIAKIEECRARRGVAG
jgi:hypothetical protein